eukprot:scaffold1936_cov201-Alexandrium_tamarense.AAC.10
MDGLHALLARWHYIDAVQCSGLAVPSPAAPLGGCTCLAGEELHNYNQYNDGLVIIVALPNSIYLN